MPAPNVSESEFVNLCHYYNGSPTKVAKHTNTNTRAVQRRMDRLKDKYGDLRGSNNYIQTIKNYGGHQQEIEFEGTAVFFSDAHFWPDHHTPQADAYSILLQILQEIKPKLVVDLGDSFDGYSLSRFPPHGWHEGPTVAEELEAVKAAKNALHSATKGDFYWTWGNHDARYDAKLAQQAGQFRDVPGFALPDHFPDWQFCQALKINNILKCVHAWRGGQHGAFNDALHSGISYISGHDHQLYVRPLSDENGTRFGIKCGTLCNPTGPQFFYTNGNRGANWTAGFVIIHFEKDRIYPEPVYVIDGQARWGGKVWRA